jgi:cell division protein FtsB
MNNLMDFVPYLMTVITGVAGWIVRGRAKEHGERKRERNDLITMQNKSLVELQSSINFLAEENKKLVVEVTGQRKQIEVLQTEISVLRGENNALQREIKGLRGELSKYIDDKKE